MIDGILFSGGNDLDPTSWGEDYKPGTVPIDPQRERFERALLAEVERRKIPTLGICLGCQLINVHRGGSLVQFLPEVDRDKPLEHRKGETDNSHQHAVQIDSDTIAAKAIGKTQFIANTSHKQAVRESGRGLRIIAKAPDGVVEGVEDPSMPLMLGVQWHPERMHDKPEHLALFKLLVEKAGEFAQSK
jgi:putative glutamine amidotransferase